MVALRYTTEVVDGDDKIGLVVGVSHKVTNFDKLDIKVLDDSGNALDFSLCVAGSNKRRSISSSWMIILDKETFINSGSISLQIKSPALDGKNLY